MDDAKDVAKDVARADQAGGTDQAPEAPEAPGAGRAAGPSASEIQAAWSDPKQANIIYHDAEAGSYDAKWSISFDDRCIDYARDRFVTIAGRAGWPYPNALEIGAGTGFFLLNLVQAGVVARDGAHVSDISPGMVATATRNAASLGLTVAGRVADAESVPYPDASFDLVVGHAVLHHIPDVERALREVLRVLRPGGRFVFAGEPTRYGDVVARRLSRATWWATTRATRLPMLRGWARPAGELAASSAAHALESVVDLHTFVPAELAAMARRAGAAEVKVRTEELTAAWFGWPVRTFECAVAEPKLGFGYRMRVYRTWQRLAAFDARYASRVVPAGLFYNALVTGVRAPDGRL
ncbi:class I SAM-dependent methyltransferase [Frankia sp. CiP1_Cm_nod2]|uniref:class I SAM-dependent methyltransferase n=1 Tax=Frankia sp. CiP1_Cm_nod2 TaxID=2897161 RepID=UPI0020252829